MQKLKAVLNKKVLRRQGSAPAADEPMAVMEEEQEDRLVISKEQFILKNDADFKKVYQLKTKLGQGGYGQVYKCKHRGNHQRRVAKVISKRHLKNQERFKLEIECLKKLDNPGILKLFEYFEDDGHVYLVTEYCKGGELFDRIVDEGHFAEQEAARLFRQIL
jgi:calcium-dependent protein kinase